MTTQDEIKPGWEMSGAVQDLRLFLAITEGLDPGDPLPYARRDGTAVDGAGAAFPDDDLHGENALRNPDILA
ncbi:MAG TPA: hypothetical protein VHE78_07500 [Gemmatimonadaceae bacterium]|nr:hypothetical protein [Gemmatimonadaceae bacterium]